MTASQILGPRPRRTTASPWSRRSARPRRLQISTNRAPVGAGVSTDLIRHRTHWAICRASSTPCPAPTPRTSTSRSTTTRRSARSRGTKEDAENSPRTRSAARPLGDRRARTLSAVRAMSSRRTSWSRPARPARTRTVMTPWSSNAISARRRPLDGVEVDLNCHPSMPTGAKPGRSATTASSGA